MEGMMRKQCMRRKKHACIFHESQLLHWTVKYAAYVSLCPDAVSQKWCTKEITRARCIDFKCYITMLYYIYR